jgi:FAD/FMN-containing dehydrogenase
MSQRIGTAYEGDDGIESAARWLRRDLRGRLHRRGDAEYDARRRAFSPTLDSRPAMVVEAFGAADVRAAVGAAGEYGLPFAVQGTGHGTHAPCDGGILVRTGAMATVLVDPDRRTAHVGAGTRWADVLAAAAPFGLAPLSGSDPSVGVAGYTLGGGLGWLARRHGFAADSLRRAEVVTAEGGLVTASADEHPDLFWALRGGGGSFGIVTAMEIALHPVARVYAGTAYFAIDRAAETLARYRDWIADAPDALSTAVLLTTLRGERALALRVMHVGEADEAERLLAPLRAAAGPALLDEMRVTRFADATMGGTAPRHLDLFDTLPDEAIDVLLAAGKHATVEVRHWGGAISRPAPDAGPVGHRSVALSAIVDAPSPGLAAALAPYATGGTFLNFLADIKRTETAFTTPNLRRLRAVKRAYDPDEVFSIGHAIAPAPAPAPRNGARARLLW